MYKRSFISFASLFIFWIVISGVINLEHIILGIIIASLTVWFWKDLDSRLPSLLSPRELLLFGRCILILIGYVIKSNINVGRKLLFSNLSEPSIFMELEPRIESNWGKVFLATSITITPGTITVDFDPESHIFTVHALTSQIGLDLYYWQIINEIRNLERQIKRRKIHVLDNGRVHDSDSSSTTKSNDGTNGN